MDAFLKILNMSITAAWLSLAVVLARLFLKKAPKWITWLMWALVAVRLICPFSIESALSLIPSAETIPSGIEMEARAAIDHYLACGEQTDELYIGVKTGEAMEFYPLR